MDNHRPTRRCKPSDYQLKLAFKAHDREKTGRLDAVEVLGAVATLGVDIGMEEVLDKFGTLNNGPKDGLDFAKFTKLVRSPYYTTPNPK